MDYFDKNYAEGNAFLVIVERPNALKRNLLQRVPYSETQVNGKKISIV